MSDDRMRPFFDRYFPTVLDYPNPVDVMMEPGTLLSYVSTTFLNGWINYVEINAAFLVTRYRPHPLNLIDAAAFQASGAMHTDARTGLHDDLVILARAEHRPTEWWFFYSDQDVSDCQIGRFFTDDDPALVSQLFERHAAICAGEGGDPIRIEVSAFHRWITL